MTGRVHERQPWPRLALIGGRDRRRGHNVRCTRRHHRRALSQQPRIIVPTMCTTGREQGEVCANVLAPRVLLTECLCRIARRYEHIDKLGHGTSPYDTRVDEVVGLYI